MLATVCLRGGGSLVACGLREQVDADANRAEENTR